MTMNSINLSNKLDNYTISLYELLTKTSEELGIEFFIIGATARDLILEYSYNIRPHRATADIDLGIKIDEWQQFIELKEALFATESFTKTKTEHRICYRETHPIDIVPFGAVSEDNVISWPPEHDILMNVSGFNQAYEGSIKVRIRESPLLEIKISSLQSLVALKLLAWKDRGITDDRDAKDIATIIKYYGDPVNAERLFSDEPDLMIAEEHNLDKAGARLLGRDIVMTTGKILSMELLSILEEETLEDGQQRLPTQMSTSVGREDFEEHITLLDRVKQGINDKIQAL